MDGPYKALITKKRKTREKTKKELNENDKRILAQNVQVMDALYKAFDEDTLERVKDCKNTQEIWRKLEEFYENKNPNFREEMEECSTLNSNEEENIDDVIAKKLLEICMKS